MRTRKTTIVASLAAAFALVATASLAGAAAPAQAFYHKNTEHRPAHSLLRFPKPAVPKFRPCWTKNVTLPRGSYVHGAYIVSQRDRTNPDLENASKVLRVRVPTPFNWTICRGWNPDPNPDAFDPAAYQVRSTLSPARGGPDHVAFMTFQNDGGSPVIHGTGNYEWGGRIERDCRGCTSPSR